MNMLRSIPDLRPIVYPALDPDREVTPLDDLRDGEEWAMKDFCEWLGEERIYDLVTQHVSCVASHLETLQNEWHKSVLKRGKEDYEPFE